MVRLVVGLFIFAVVLCAYIVLSSDQPQPRRSVQESVQEPVEAAVEAPVLDIAPDPAQVKPRVSEPPVSEVITTPVEDALNEALALGYPTSSEQIGYSVANILIGLGVKSNSFGIDLDAAAKRETAFDRAVLQGLNERMDDPDIMQLILDKTQRGLVRVPEVLVRADKGIDTASLLDSVIVEVLEVKGTPRDVRVALSERNDVTLINGQAFYEVVESDSLAGLSLKFYNDLKHIDLLLQVNKVILKSPAHIAKGQTLLIPTSPF